MAGEAKAIGTPGKPKAEDPYEPDEGALEKVGMDSEALNSVFKEIEPTVRTQVNDTFAAIF